MATMLDTSVLSFLAMSEPVRGSNDHDQWNAARQESMRLGEVVISAVSWFELHQVRVPGKPDSFAEEIRRSCPVDVRELDVAVTDVAARMLVKARRGWTACPKCSVVVGERTCSACNRVVPNAFRTNDALIVAHASLLSDVDLLLTFDSGMIDLAKFAPKSTPIKVERPEHPHGKLWEHAAARAKAKGLPPAT